MIRQAVAGEGGMVHERLVAEIAREGQSYPAPSPGSIEIDISVGQQWYIDDDDPTVIAHALKGSILDPDTGRHVDGVLVPHVWNKSERDEEVLRFLAVDLLRLYGDLPATYPSANGARIAKADQLVKPRIAGGKRLTTLGAAAKLLTARERGIRP